MDIQYFAAKPAEELAPEIMDRVEDFYLFVKSSPIFSRIRRSYQAYYGIGQNGFSSTKLGNGGDQNELVTMKVNQYRSIIQGLLNLTTSQKAAFEVRATNTDFKSQSQTILAQGILDYYLREKNLERLLREAVEICLWGADGYIMASWEPTGGEEHMVNPDTGGVEYQGDILYQTKHALDVIRDLTSQQARDPNWLIVRSFKNKYDLAAKFPDLAEKILSVVDTRNVELDRLATSVSMNEKESDLISYYEFFHRKSDSIRDGRYMIALDGDTWLFDGPLPYRKIPIHRIAASELHGTPFGYSPAFDLLSVQEIYDILHSTVATNQSTHGVGNVWTKPGSGLVVQQLRGGMNHWESEEAPEAINLTNTPAEIFNHMQYLDTLFEKLPGLGAMSRGGPTTQMSGAAMALVASQAVQFNSGLQQAWANLLEDVGTATFEILQDFAKVPRIAVIVGKHNRSLMKEFSADDIQQVSRVVVDLGNPLSRTTAGRVEMANQLLQAQKFETPEEYLNVITTGKLEPLTESRQTQLLNIRAENEKLRDAKAPQVGPDGQPIKIVKALLTDKHPLHILEHMSVLDDPDTREEPDVVNAVLAHVQDHLGLWEQMPPTLLNLLGIPPAQPAQPMGMPGGPPPGGAPQGPGANPATLDQQPVVTHGSGVKGPHMPHMPKGSPDGLKEAYGQVKQNTPTPPQAG